MAIPIPKIEGNSFWDQYQPSGQPQYGGGVAGDFSDPYNLYLSSIPIMQRNVSDQVGSAISSLAPGNRYSSEAYRQAGQAGLQGGMGMNHMLSQLMFDQYNTDADRALQAAGGLMAGGGMVEGALGQRYGKYENALKNRQAQQAANWQSQYNNWQNQKAQQMAVARMQYSDFEKNKYGTLPMLMGMARNDLGMTPQPILSTSPGKQGYGDDILKVLATYLQYT